MNMNILANYLRGYHEVSHEMIIYWLWENLGPRGLTLPLARWVWPPCPALLRLWPAAT